MTRYSEFSWADTKDQPCVFTLTLTSTGKPLQFVAVHLKAKGDIGKHWKDLKFNDSADLNKIQMEALLSIYSKSPNTIMLGDFNFGVKLERMLKDYNLENDLYSVVRAEIKRKRGIDLVKHDFMPALSGKLNNATINTMVDTRKKKINDFILIPRTLKDANLHSGILRPDVDPERRIPLDNYTLVSMSFVHRLRAATFTDHWPIWATLPTLPE